MKVSPANRIAMATLFLLTLLFVVNYVVGDVSDVGLNPGEMITNHGYASETHQITTEDGYILTIYRISHGVNNIATSNKPAVLLMHGFLSCSAEFVSMGPDYALGYILADAGYDVWLPNARGTQFSRNHTTLNPDLNAAKFFDFTWHEIGIYDVANTIDYILELKGVDSLYYVGHSQGTTAFLALASVKPEYNDKIKMASLMAPAAIVQNYPSFFIKTIADFTDQIYDMTQLLSIYEVPVVAQIREIASVNCKFYPENYTDPNCDVIHDSFMNKIDKHYLPIVGSNEPANSAIKPYIHYGQLVKNGGFRQFDFGAVKNLEVYGTEVPPDYDLSKISIPIAFYYAQNDGLIAVKDELALVDMIPNVIINYLVPDEKFAHQDFGNSQTAVNLVYKKLLEIMSNN